MNDSGVTTEGFRKKVDQLPLAGTEEEVEKTKAELVYRFGELYDDFNEKQIEVYAKYLSDEAIEGAINFYTSAAGEEIIRQLPKINDEQEGLSDNLRNDAMKLLLTVFDDNSFFEIDSDGPDYSSDTTDE